VHPLDNPIWEALSTSHIRFAESAGSARRFFPDVSLLAGFQGMSEEGFDSLAALVHAGNSAGLFLHAPATPIAGWTIIHESPLLQMIQAHASIPSRACDFVELGNADVPEMIALAELTKPGPFGVRTRELGVYIGIRENGKLIAMAGERLRVPGYTEISAVCTHPDHLGRGHARALMAALAERIRSRGEAVFLHVRQANARATELYERIGFTRRALFHYTLFRRDAE
jgi:ribosomal protein S18 acetylase RimI-like enzyme